MKLVPYEDKWSVENTKVEKLVEELNKKLITVYNAPVHYHSICQLKAIFNIMDPYGKTILDLGCGQSFDRDRMFEPWVLRALHEYGAKCIGLDAGSLAPRFERFNTYDRINVFEENSLGMLDTHSIDIACAFALFNDPHTTIGWDLSSQIERDKMAKDFLSQLERVVKPDGYFLFEMGGIDRYLFQNPKMKKAM